jgi:hypothetical protein
MAEKHHRPPSSIAAGNPPAPSIIVNSGRPVADSIPPALPSENDVSVDGRDQQLGSSQSSSSSQSQPEGRFLLKLRRLQLRRLQEERLRRCSSTGTPPPPSIHERLIYTGPSPGDPPPPQWDVLFPPPTTEFRPVIPRGFYDPRNPSPYKFRRARTGASNATAIITTTTTTTTNHNDPDVIPAPAGDSCKTQAGVGGSNKRNRDNDDDHNGRDKRPRANASADSSNTNSNNNNGANDMSRSFALSFFSSVKRYSDASPSSPSPSDNLETSADEEGNDVLMLS